MPQPLADVLWHGDSLDKVRSFSEAARQDIGYQLQLVQQGMQPRDWKTMSIVGPGVVEIRVHAENEYRVLYVARRNDAVHVLTLSKRRPSRPGRQILKSHVGDFESWLTQEVGNDPIA